jgi:hypothetical protein
LDPRCLQRSDTTSKKKALEVFKSFFKPGTIVEVHNIYEFLASTGSGCAPPPPKKQKATPSTDAKCVGGTSAGVNTDLAAQAAAREPELPSRGELIAFLRQPPAGVPQQYREL